jgi:hypothetical protein
VVVILTESEIAAYFHTRSTAIHWVLINFISPLVAL